MLSKKLTIFKVKLVILVCVIVALVGLYFYVNSGKKDIRDCNLVDEDLSLYYRICGRITCQVTGDVSIIGCGRYQCEQGKNQIGYKLDDLSKPYPKCCGGPVCHG